MVELRVDETNSSAWDRACTSYANGLLHDAYQALHRHLSKDPECGRGWELLGLVYHAWQQWGPAVAALEEASVRVPMNSVSTSALADCYLAEGRTPWARDLYRELIEREQVTVKALLSAASGLDVISEPREAVRACQRAIELEPDTAQAYFDLSYYLSRTGADVSKIEAAARRAIGLAPDNITYRVGLAGFLHQRDRSSDAAALLEAMTLEHVQLMRCRCCLARLIGLFEAVGDDERAAWCRQRQESLLMTGGGENC